MSSRRIHVTDHAIQRFLERYDIGSATPEADILALLGDSTDAGTTPTGERMVIHARRPDLAFVLRTDRADPAAPFDVVVTIMPSVMRLHATSLRVARGRRREEHEHRRKERYERVRAW